MSKRPSHWYRNEELNSNKRIYEGDEIPKGYTREAYSAWQSIIQSGSNHPNYGKHHSEETKKKMSVAQKGKIVSEETRCRQSIAAKNRDWSNFHPNHKGKNNPRYGIRYTMTDEKRKAFLEKRHNTMHKNNSFNKSKAEENYYKLLLENYSEDDIKRNHSTDKYPFRCDFYIPSEDRYIECNYHWTHGGHPFDPNNLDDIAKLELWQEKAKTSKFYKNAIKTWTERDVKKIQTARENNLNIEFLYEGLY